MDDTDAGLTWDRNRARRERLWAKDTAVPVPAGHDRPVDESIQELTAYSELPGDRPEDDSLAAAHEILAQRIAERRRAWNSDLAERLNRSAKRRAARERTERASAETRERAQAERQVRAAERAEVDAVLAEYDRPRTRADCENGPRPCPWVGCRHHLALEVNPETGNIKLQERDPAELEHSCSLDLADRGGMTLEEIGDVLGVTRERARQLEAYGIKLLRHARRKLV